MPARVPGVAALVEGVLDPEEMAAPATARAATAAAPAIARVICCFVMRTKVMRMRECNDREV